MAKIKKVYIELVEFLQANENKTVKDVLPEVLSLTRSKINRVNGESFIKDKSGNLVAALCFYYKRWMPLVGEKAVEFGVKANTKTGLNTMSKKGLELWLAQQKTAKKASEQILVDIQAKTLKIEDIPKRQEEIEADRLFTAPTNAGFKTKLVLFEYLQKQGIVLAKADLELAKQPAKS